MSAPEFCREIRADEATKVISLLLVVDREHPAGAVLQEHARAFEVLQGVTHHYPYHAVPADAHEGIEWK